MNEVNKKNRKWLTGYYLATYILAAVALFGLYLSIITSSNVASMLESMETRLDSITNSMTTMQCNLDAMSVPLIKFKTIQWIKEKGELSCENPPIGTEVKVYNASNVVVMINNLGAKLFFGERELSPATVKRDLYETSERVLSAGEETSHLIIRKDELKKYLGKKRKILTLGPHLRLEISIKYHRIGDSRMYLYIAEKEVQWDCTNPDTTLITTLSEKIEEI